MSEQTAVKDLVKGDGIDIGGDQYLIVDVQTTSTGEFDLQVESFPDGGDEKHYVFPGDVILNVI